MDKQAIFNNLTAWFAKSVLPKRKTLWVKHGGSVIDVNDAQFIFSQDVEEWDTLRLFHSEGYLSGCLTVFHASYIDACIRNQSAHQTPVGNFLLLPKDIHKEGQLHRDFPRRSSTSTAGITKAMQSRNTTITSRTQEVNGDNYLQEDDTVNHRTDNSGRLAHAPSANRLDNESSNMQESSSTSEEEIREDHRNQRGLSDDPESPERQTCISRRSDAPKFQNIDISKVPHVRDLPKLTGPVVDFIIGKNGCGVQKIKYQMTFG